MIARVPTDFKKPRLTGIIVKAISKLTDDDVTGNVVVIDPSQLRIRRAHDVGT